MACYGLIAVNTKGILSIFPNDHILQLLIIKEQPHSRTAPTASCMMIGEKQTGWRIFEQMIRDPTNFRIRVRRPRVISPSVHRYVNPRTCPKRNPAPRSHTRIHPPRHACEINMGPTKNESERSSLRTWPRHFTNHSPGMISICCIIGNPEQTKQFKITIMVPIKL